MTTEPIDWGYDERKLARILKDNPGHTIVLDNDCWWMYGDEDEETGYRECIVKGDTPPEHELLRAMALTLEIETELC